MNAAFQLGIATAIVFALTCHGLARAILWYESWRVRRVSQAEDIVDAMDMDLFAAADATAARDRALEQVTVNNADWMATALAEFDALFHFEGTGEDLRVRLIKGGLDAPKHHNAWGPLVLTLIRRKRLLPTGEMRSMTTKRSNARRTPVYRKAAA